LEEGCHREKEPGLYASRSHGPGHLKKNGWMNRTQGKSKKGDTLYFLSSVGKKRGGKNLFMGKISEEAPIGISSAGRGESSGGKGRRSIPLKKKLS